MPPNQIESRSRSARSPALPTAITTRPQLASSPAIAVLTSGELAIESAILRAEDFDTAPSTMISTSLRAPSPSRAICSARLARTASNALRNAGSRGSDTVAIFDTPRAAAAPVANASSVSEVEVSPSIVTALKLSATPCLSRPCNTRGEIRGELGRRAAGFASEGIGVAGIDHERARRAALKMRAAPIDRGGRTFRPCEDASHARALLEQGQQHVGAAAIADAGGGGRQFDPRHRRHIGKAGGRERGDGCCHGIVSLSWPERTAQRYRIRSM